MSIKSDKWVRRMAEEYGLIEPFVPYQVRESELGQVISYGTSSYGYDIRCADEFKIFTNINSAIVDPKNFDANSFVDIKSDVCIIPPNSFALARSLEYFRIPRNVLTICLGKSTYARCFRGDTRVALLNGTEPTLEEMARRSDEGERFWGYSIGPSGRIIAAPLEVPRFIGRDGLLALTLDNGTVIHCTPDHQFILRDGRWVEAYHLRPNDSLMPLYRQVVNDHEFVYQPSNGHLDPTQRLANEWPLRNGIYADVPSAQRHYEDRSHRFPTIQHDWSAFRSFPAGHDLFHDPKPTPYNHKVSAVRELAGDHDVYCLTVPETGNFALACGVFVSNCGIIVNVTPLEPDWEGHVTLEFSNTTPLPAKIYANEGVAQVIFLESDEACEVSYRDRKGKYQGQRGVTLPKA